MIETLSWTGSALRLLDQTRLPTQTSYVELTGEHQVHDAIRRLVVRGAPAIGVAAAFGAYLGVRDFPGTAHALMLRLSEVCDYLATSRPTAVNLVWALKRLQRVALAELHETDSLSDSDEGAREDAARLSSPKSSDAERGAAERDAQVFAAGKSAATRVKQRLLDECLAMIDEDKRVCRAIGEHGAQLLRSLASGSSSANLNILTHCNAGSLATVGYGTALAPIYVGAQRGLRFHVYADETRPLLQGSRLTAYELKQNGVPVTVMCDGMAAALMSAKRLDAVIVGTDRVAANGDVANKIGTLALAIQARHFGVPLVVAAPTSSIDLECPTGRDIPIEFRDGAEVTRGLGAQTAPEGVDVFNPAFDVTPAELVTAIITERGVVRAPYDRELRRIMEFSAQDGNTVPDRSA
jgi:methylthioribose-1-phosphate isomerase